VSALQQQARALGDPTRHAVFRHIAEATGPVGIAELTDRFGVNHNAIRQHLAKLADAGLVIEAKAPTGGRGRPRLVYTLAPAVEGQWGTTGPYERLSLLLVDIIATGRSAEEVGRLAGERLAAGTPSGDVVADVAAAMARQGFDPEVRATGADGRGDGGATEMVLHRCPFASTAGADRDTVCSLHLGIAEGLAEGTDLVVDELVAHDPRTADCVLRLHVDDGAVGSPPAPRLSLRGPARAS
jgi:predicted ArsR family transcriptional regulator